MQKWEYREEPYFGIERLNEAGRNGWELVNVYSLSNGERSSAVYAVFKRPIKDPAQEQTDKSKAAFFNHG